MEEKILASPALAPNLLWRRNNPVTYCSRPKEKEFFFLNWGKVKWGKDHCTADDILQQKV